MVPVILSGGSGTRLWPVSRASYPKQFCEFYDQTFLQNTIRRLSPLGDPFIVTLESMKALTWRTASELGLKAEHMIYEPFGKNTAAAVALMCHKLKVQGLEGETVGVFPADHLITDEDAFYEAVRLGQKVADREVVTLGITPRSPATGYGYIEVTEQVVGSEGKHSALRVQGFREKPDLKTAEVFAASGRHFWNAGMFLFRADVMIQHFEKFLPDLWRKISSIKPDLSNAKYAYATVPSLSLDVGIMEKIPNIACIPCQMGWSDVGSWDEIARLAEEFPKLRTGTMASVFSQNSQRNYVFSIKNKVVGLVGMEEAIVVDTPDALLIAKKGESQKVKELVEQMAQAGLPAATEHPFETRPWGGFEVLSDSEKFKVKKLTVDPGAQLSYQSHRGREEHWVVVTGQATIVLNDTVHTVNPGQHFFIPRGAKHRLANRSNGPLVVVEMQTGDYFGEDDITRYEDDYNRA